MSIHDTFEDFDFLWISEMNSLRKTMAWLICFYIADLMLGWLFGPYTNETFNTL